MKYFHIFIIVLFTLSSCSPYNRIGEFNDSSKGIKELTLKQNPRAVSTEKVDAISGSKQSWSFVSMFRYEQTGSKRPEMFVDFQLSAPDLLGQPDSVLYFKLDGERIRLVTAARSSGAQARSTAPSEDFKSGKESALKMNRENLQFLVPENLWVSIANVNEIQYNIYVGKEEIDVNLNPAETDRLKRFFRQACAMRDDAFPAIPTHPPGLKKW